MSFPHLCPFHSQHWTSSFLKLLSLWFLEQGWGHQFSQSWRERLIMLVPSLPSCLLRCESCLQVQLSDLPTKAEDNLTFLLGRLNFVQAPTWLPKHISSICFWAFRKAVQFILLVSSSGHIAPVTPCGPLIPTLPETPCLYHPGPSPALPHPCLFSYHILSSLLLVVCSAQTCLPSPFCVCRVSEALWWIFQTLSWLAVAVQGSHRRAVVTVCDICPDSPCWLSRLSRCSPLQTNLIFFPSYITIALLVFLLYYL